MILCAPASWYHFAFYIRRIMTMTQSSDSQQSTPCKTPNIDTQLCFALYSTSRAITKQYATLLKDLDVTYPQYLVLLVLWENDSLTVQEIACAMELEGATTTPLIQRMEKLGLLSRQRSKEDERKVNVVLTDKGKALKKEAQKIPEQLGCALGVDDDFAMELIGHMNAIKKHLKMPSKNTLNRESKSGK